jgi:thioredoxin 1
MIELTNQNFDYEVMNSDKVVIVDMFAHWCPPCRMLTPILENFSKNNPNVKVCKVNVDENRDLAATYEISTIPVLLFFKNGSLVKRLSGLQNEVKLNDAVASLMA